MEIRSPKGLATRDRILEAALRLFNEHGYGNTPVAGIAAEAGMAVGNLCYHFPTKRALVIALLEGMLERLRLLLEESRAPAGPEDALIPALARFGYRSMQSMWEYRFAWRDRLQYGEGRDGIPVLARTPEAAEHLDLVRTYLTRLQEQGAFASRSEDVEYVATNMWIVARYWWDYLDEREGITSPSWSDQERGFQQVFAVLTAHLTAAARREIERASEELSRT